MVEDLETGTRYLLDASNAATRQRFTAEKRREHDRAKEILKSADIDCIDISTGRSVTDALVKYFQYREKIKR
jgi:hypothetical protein